MEQITIQFIQIVIDFVKEQEWRFIFPFIILMGIINYAVKSKKVIVKISPKIPTVLRVVIIGIMYAIAYFFLMDYYKSDVKLHINNMINAFLISMAFYELFGFSWLFKKLGITIDNKINR